jgi:predicted dehydrogenase
MSEHDGPRAAIVGAGLMGRWHADAVRRIGGRVTVIVDPNGATREALGRRHPQAQLIAELDPELIKRHATVAHVCTPLPTHVAVMTSLIGAGLHLLVEKPFTESAQSTEAVLSLAEARGVIVCPVHQFLFQDGIRQLLEWLPSMGPVRRLEFSTCSAGATGADPASLDDLIGEILPHPLAIISTVLRTRIGSTEWHVAHPSPGEFRAMTTLCGTIVDLAISAHGRPTENVVRVMADGGSATADLFHGYAVRRSGAVSRAAKIAQPFAVSMTTLGVATVNLIRRAVRREPAYPGLRRLVHEFYQATRSGGGAPISYESVTDAAECRDRLIAHLR